MLGVDAVNNLDAGFQDPPRGTFHGHAWRDVNANGLRDGGEPALAGGEFVVPVAHRYRVLFVGAASN